MTCTAERTVKELCKIVVNDVMTNIAPLFTEEQIGHDVLHELQKLWERKLIESGAITLVDHLSQSRTYAANFKIVPQSDGNSDSSEEDTSSGSKLQVNTDEGDDTSLNSNDDLTDEESEDAFQTENIILCQYEKVNKRSNKWRFVFSSGIMNLNKKDYAFKVATGTAEW